MKFEHKQRMLLRILLRTKMSCAELKLISILKIHATILTMSITALELHAKSHIHHVWITNKLNSRKSNELLFRHQTNELTQYQLLLDYLFYDPFEKKHIVACHQSVARILQCSEFSKMLIPLKSNFVSGKSHQFCYTGISFDNKVMTNLERVLCRYEFVIKVVLNSNTYYHYTWE